MYRRGPVDPPTPLDPHFLHLLLVEGQEDGRFYEQVCQHAGVADRIEIRQVGGWARFAPALRTLVGIGTHLRTIAIVRDAEQNGRGAFQSACAAFQQAGLPQPSQPGRLSAPDAQGRCTAALIVPIDSSGSIESVCWASLSGHPSLPCVERFLECIDTRDVPASSYTAAVMDKRRLWSLFAAGVHNPRHMNPGGRLAEAAEQGFWDWTHTTFDPIVTFVRTVARLA